MRKYEYFLCSIIMAMCCLQRYCLSQSTTVRPYKFGFTIDQQQHRSEKRDERGIVMGEFGFITADGIYHVTVYATDEQGRFRILAMKNYPYESPPKTVEVMVKPKIPTTTTTTPKPLTRHNFNTAACSGCFLNNGNNKPKDVNGVQVKTMKNDIRPLSRALPGETNKSSVPKISNKIPSGKKSISNQMSNIIKQVNTGKTMLFNRENQKLLNNSQIDSIARKTNAQFNKGNSVRPDYMKTIQINTLSNPILFSFEKTFTKATNKNYEHIVQTPLNIATQHFNKNSLKPQETHTLTANNVLQNKQLKAPSVQYQQIDFSATLLENNTKFLKATPTNLRQHPTHNYLPPNLQTKATLQNTPLANSFKSPEETRKFSIPLNTYNTNSGHNKPNVDNALSKDTNHYKTSKPKVVSTGLTPASKTATGNSKPPIMDIIMQKVLPTLMGSKDSAPTTTLNTKLNVPSGKKSSSNSGNDSSNDSGDLYRFKYILDYHGHSETGKRNGNKEGTYYSIGDDNVERTIDYVANEFGYQPRIRWRKLDSNEIKSKENTLKDYEFVWFN